MEGSGKGGGKVKDGWQKVKERWRKAREKRPKAKENRWKGQGKAAKGQPHRRLNPQPLGQHQVADRQARTPIRPAQTVHLPCQNKLKR